MHGTRIEIIKRVVQIFQKSMSRLKRLCSRRVTQSNFYREGSQTLGATARNLVAWVTWSPEFARPCKLICFTMQQESNQELCPKRTNSDRNFSVRNITYF